MLTNHDHLFKKRPYIFIFPDCLYNLYLLTNRGNWNLNMKTSSDDGISGSGKPYTMLDKMENESEILGKDGVVGKFNPKHPFSTNQIFHMTTGQSNFINVPLRGYAFFSMFLCRNLLY